MKKPKQSKRKAEKASRDDGAAQLVKRVNDYPPTRQQMLAFAQACAQLPRGEEDYDVLHVVAWARLFPGHRKQGLSAQFRMQALARLVTEGPLPGWSESGKGPEGAHLTRDTLFAAAAAEPVILRAGDVAFDRESLVQRAFQLAKAPHAE